MVYRRSGPNTAYTATWDLRLSYNTTGVVHVPSSDPLVPVSDMGTTGARAMGTLFVSSLATASKLLAVESKKATR
jgi:hypothetical protein